MALHRSIIRQGTSMLDKQAIKTLRTFRLAIIKEGPDLAVFAHPSTLSRLAVWLVDAVRDLIDKEKSGKPRKSLPFVVAALDEKRDSFLVVGMNGAAEYGDVRKKWALHSVLLWS
jgi:cell division control protein 45